MTFEQKLKDEAYYAREEGLKEGLEKGRAEGKAEGAAETQERLIRKLMEAQSLTREEAERILSL